MQGQSWAGAPQPGEAAAHGWAVPAGVACPQRGRAHSFSALVWFQNEQPQLFPPLFVPFLDLRFATVSCFIKVSSVSKVSEVLKKDCLHDASSQGAKGEDVLSPNVRFPAITGSVHGDAPFLTNAGAGCGPIEQGAEQGCRFRRLTAFVHPHTQTWPHRTPRLPQEENLSFSIRTHLPARNLLQHKGLSEN